MQEQPMGQEQSIQYGQQPVQGMPVPSAGQYGQPMQGMPVPPAGQYGQPVTPMGQYGQPMPPMGQGQPMQGMPVPSAGQYGQPMPPMGQGQPMQGAPIPPAGQYTQPMPSAGQPMGQPMQYGQPPMPPYGAAPNLYQQPYAPAVPPAQPEGKQSRKPLIIVSVIIGVILIAIVALILISIQNLQEKGGKDDGGDYLDPDKVQIHTEEEQDKVWEEEDKVYNYYDGYNFLDDTDMTFYDVTQENWGEEGQDTTLPYYSGPYNDLRDDLSYEVSFTDAVYTVPDDIAGLVHIEVEFPQIKTGNNPYADFINDVLAYEYVFCKEFFVDNVAPYMTNEMEYFWCEVDSYVTYMDERILSVVFHEEVQVNVASENWATINFYCVNLDLETGNWLDNTEILKMDDAFAVDFRKREAYENGNEALVDFTDQEILEMLEDEAYLVLFYTPMGLEVGLNLDHIVVYVTYEDYENYLNKF